MVTTAPAIESKAASRASSWRLRDTLAAAVLFLGSVAFVLWQNLRVAVLWDVAYLLDSSYRMAVGQVPYRDFPFVHPPLTFLVQAALMRVFGRHFLVVAIYAALASGTGTVVAWRLFLSVSRAVSDSDWFSWVVSLCFAAPLTVLGIYAIYPHPIYDGDAALAILVALFLLAKLEEGPQEGARSFRVRAVLAGAACVLPLFFKQNMGLPFLLMVVGGVALAAAWDVHRERSITTFARSPYTWVLAGAAVALAMACGLIGVWAGLGNYLHWTVQFAAQRRMPGLLSNLAIYAQPQLAWMLPALAAGLALCHTRLLNRNWIRIAAIGLISSPFVAVAVFFVLQADIDLCADELLLLWPLWMAIALVLALVRLRRGITLQSLIPFFALAAIHGAFLSQKLWGSSYAVWPLLLLLIVQVLAANPVRQVAMACSVVAWVTLLVCGGLYAHSLERLNYIQFPDEPVETSSLAALRGMPAQGNYLRDFDQLVGFTEREIPRGEGILLLPGEDPFYFATGRVPHFPVLLFDPTTDPYSPAELVAEARRNGVRWVIVKRNLQLCDNPFPDFEPTISLLEHEFTLYRKLDAYDVYRR